MYKNTNIVVSSGVGTELTRSIARSGNNLFNCRVMSPFEFAYKYIVNQGLHFPYKILSSNEQVAVLSEVMKDGKYFSNTSYFDVEKVAMSLNELRSIIVCNEAEEIVNCLGRSDFIEKSSELIKIYNGYVDKCAEDNLMDEIMVIRFAIDNCKEEDTSFVKVKECRFSPLEDKFIDVISGDKVLGKDLFELFSLERKDIRIADIKKAYGSINEVKDILFDIINRKIPFDNCLIAATDTGAYSQLFFELAQQYDIQITFGTGVSINNANPVKLLKHITEWQLNDGFERSGLKSLIYSDAFDRKKLAEFLPEGVKLSDVIDIAGNLRLSMNKKYNERKITELRETEIYKEKREVIDAVELIFNDFSKGVTYIVSNYSLVRHRNSHLGKIDKASFSAITETINAYRKYTEVVELDKILPEIMKRKVSAENSREGYIHFTNIDSSKFVLRDNIYIVGMNASVFPGRAVENPVILDDEYKYFEGKIEEDKLPYSVNLVKYKTKSFNQLIEIYSSITTPKISYVDFDLATLKDENPSSELFEVYRESNKGATFNEFQNSMVPVGFFEDILSYSDGIGKGYLENKVNLVEHKDVDEFISFDFNKKLSPSAIETYLACKRRFMYGRLLKLGERDDALDNEWMTSLDRGDLSHYIMEITANKNYAKREFMDVVVNVLDGFSKEKISDFDEKSEYEDFLNMMERAYETDPKNEVISSEEWEGAVHSSGIKIFGKPDRVEKLPSGKYIIVDYKSGSKMNAKKDDCESCIQVLLYAYMLEQEGYDIERCEYRYISYGETITCEYTEDIKTSLAELLNELHTSLVNSDYPLNEDEGECTYCSYKELCGREEDESYI